MAHMYCYHCVMWSVHLPLSAGRIVMLGSILRDVRALLSWVVRLEGGSLAFDRASEIFSQHCLSFSTGV